VSTGGYFGEFFFCGKGWELVLFLVFLFFSGLDPVGLFGWVIVMGLGVF